MNYSETYANWPALKFLHVDARFEMSEDNWHNATCITRSAPTIEASSNISERSWIRMRTNDALS